ncbi:MAG: PaaI family thioesterase [Thermoplasmatota archaeon]
MDEEFREIDLEDFVKVNRSFVSGRRAERAMNVRYFLNDKGDLKASVYFEKGSEGPPGHAHGGATAAVIDEAMGLACWFKMIPVVTKTLTTHFLKMIPIGTKAVITTELTEGEGKYIIASSTLFDQKSGAEYARGEGIYRRISLSKLSGMPDLKIEMNGE